MKKNYISALLLILLLTLNTSAFAQEITLDIYSVNGVAAIVSGHTHKKVMGKVNNILIVQADWSGRAVGHIQLTYDSDSKKVVHSSVEFIILQPGNYPLDQKIAKDFEQYQNNILPLKNKIIGHLSTTLVHNKM